jgi:hypothetical protein
VSHGGPSQIYIKKYLKAKEKNYENSKIFHHPKIYSSKKNPLKEAKKSFQIS